MGKTITKFQKIQAKDHTQTWWHGRVKGWAKKASNRYTRRTVRARLRRV